MTNRNVGLWILEQEEDIAKYSKELEHDGWKDVGGVWENGQELDLFSSSGKIGLFKVSKEW